MIQKEYSCVAKTVLGFEQILADELVGLQCKNVEVLNRAVSFNCDKATLYRVNLSSRFAISFLVNWANFWARDEENFYKQMKALNWEEILSNDKTFMVQAQIPRCNIFSHSQYAALKSKDAIADFFSEKFDRRPNVDTVDPDVKVNVHINGNKVNVSLNSSGEALFKRGYRVAMAPAPINEVLAAGLIELSGWSSETPFYDPMCGSATIPIEAAMKARNIPPGHKRRFGFQNWLNFTPALWDMVYDQEMAKIDNEVELKIYASDKDNEALNAARENIQASGMEDDIMVSRKDFLESEWTKPELPFILFNPPYDKRLQERDVISFYKEIGDTLKFKYSGTQAWLITSNMEAAKFIGLRPSEKVKVFNGSLECRFLKYEMYRGSKNKNKSKKP